jgi:hypothetical protein
MLVPFGSCAMVAGADAQVPPPAILVVGGSPATQYLWSNFVDSNPVDIAAGAAPLVGAVALLRV